MTVHTRTKTWKDATILPHFDLNTYLRDNALAAYGQPAVRAHRGEEVEIPPGSWQTIHMPYERFDASNMHTKQQGDRLIIQSAGVYLVGMNADFEKVGGAGVRYARLFVNDDYPVAHIGPVNANATQRQALGPVGLWYFRPGDFVECQIWQNDADVLVTKGTPPNSPEVWAIRVGDRTATPTWTSPRTWANAETLTHSLLNTHVRDNVEHVLNKPACRIWGSPSLATEDSPGLHKSLTVNTWTSPDFDAEMFDTSSMHSCTTNPSRITIPTTGKYLIGACIETEKSSSSYTTEVEIIKNGTGLVRCGPLPSTSFARNRNSVVYLESFTAGDYIECQVRSQGSGPDIIATYGYAPTMWAVEVSAEFTATTWTDPKTWTSRESIASLHTDLNTYLRDNLKFLKGPPCARLSTTSATGIPDNAWTNVPMGAADFDTDSMLDGTNNCLKVNKKGKYLVIAKATFVAASGGQRGLRLKRTSNGVHSYIGTQSGIAASASDDSYVWVASLYEFAVNDLIRLEARQGSGGTINVRSGETELMAVWLSG